MDEYSIEKEINEIYERHTFREKLAELGYSLSDEDFNQAFVAFRELSDKLSH